jgi:hypothetical protein
MGVGFYLVYPTFYMDVTDSYRLGRWDRLRTDLGGIHFHLLFALGIIALYFITGQEILLAVVLSYILVSHTLNCPHWSLLQDGVFSLSRKQLQIHDSTNSCEHSDLEIKRLKEVENALETSAPRNN